MKRQTDGSNENIDQGNVYNQSTMKDMF